MLNRHIPEAPIEILSVSVELQMSESLNRHLNHLGHLGKFANGENKGQMTTLVPILQQDFIDTNHQNHQDNYNGNAQPTVNLNGDDGNPWKWIAITIVILFALSLLACCIWRLARMVSDVTTVATTGRPTAGSAESGFSSSSPGLEAAISESQAALRRQRLQFTHDRLEQEAERERERERERLDDERRRREQERLRRDERDAELAWEREAERAASLRRLQQVEQRERNERIRLSQLELETRPTIPVVEPNAPTAAQQIPIPVTFDEWLRERPSTRAYNPFSFEEFARREQGRQERLRRDREQRQHEEPPRQ